MRIVHVGTSRESMGGIASVLKLIFSSPSRYPRFQVVTHCDGSPVRLIIRSLRGWGSLICDLLRHPSSIYHLHCATGLSFYRKAVCAFTVKIFGRPLILHIHGFNYRNFYEKSGRLGRKIISTVLRQADVLVVLSKEWQAFFSEIVGGTKIVVLPNAVTLPGPRYELNPKGTGGFRIVMLGRLGLRKGTFDLIRAFAMLKRDADLYLGGDGEIELAKNRAAERGVEARVNTLGWIGEDERTALLESAHLFVLPSYAEGLPVALLEAMSFGLPVITTPVGGIPSVITDKENGLLVSPGDIDALREAIQFLCDNPDEARRLGDAARATIVERYDAQSFARSLDAIYDELSSA